MNKKTGNGTMWCEDSSLCKHAFVCTLKVETLKKNGEARKRVF